MTEDYKKELLSIIHKYIPHCTVYVFGSRARKTHREGSDIDLAIDAGKKISLNTILDIKAEIEETTIPLFVDIVDIYSVSDDLKEEIEKEGVLWED